MQPESRKPLADDHLDPAIVCTLRDALECFYRSLPPVYREVMRRSAADLENDEIGTSIGISAKTVQRISERVRNKV